MTMTALHLQAHLRYGTKSRCYTPPRHKEKWMTRGEFAGSAVIVIPCGLTSVMAEPGQSEATLSAVAIRALCLRANGGH